MRQIILDTETTGLDPAEGHRLIEFAGVELIDRRPTGRTYHQYICPERVIDAEAIAVHGIQNEFLADKPVFASIAEELLAFLAGAELVIHNAPFDVGFLNAEFKRVDPAFAGVAAHCQVLDTLALARKKHPGQQNSLDALCRRYKVDNSGRALHGALLDAQLLAEVYLAMTGGQMSLFDAGMEMCVADNTQVGAAESAADKAADSHPLKVLKADAQALAEHAAQLAMIQKISGACVWSTG
jgi:DNA polymerase-3 subunit epsilon